MCSLFFVCSRKRLQSFNVNIGRLKSKTRVILVKIYPHFIYGGKNYPRLIKLKWRDKLDWFFVQKQEVLIMRHTKGLLSQSRPIGRFTTRIERICFEVVLRARIINLSG